MATMEGSTHRTENPKNTISSGYEEKEDFRSSMSVMVRPSGSGAGGRGKPPRISHLAFAKVVKVDFLLFPEASSSPLRTISFWIKEQTSLSKCLAALANSEKLDLDDLLLCCWKGPRTGSTDYCEEEEEEEEEERNPSQDKVRVCAGALLEVGSSDTVNNLGRTFAVLRRDSPSLDATQLHVLRSHESRGRIAKQCVSGEDVSKIYDKSRISGSMEDEKDEEVITQHFTEVYDRVHVGRFP